MIETIGFIGAFCFAVCAIPQAIQCYKEGHAQGLSLLFLYLLLAGEILSFLYSCFISATFLEKIPYLINYGANILLLVVLFKYKYYPRINMKDK